jgi:2-polyprenyl-3-methyl-5-hydroxy-6-metoxy-1,4-benzoquinol methylase
MRNFDVDSLTWDDNPVRWNMAKSVFSAMAKSVPFNDTMDLLDFGCGTGLISFQALPFVHSVLCADTSQGMINVVKEKAHSAELSGIKTLLLDPEDSSSFSGSFDCILSSMTFHHVADIAALLRRLYPAVKKGGYIAIADLDPDNGFFHENNDGVYHNGFVRNEMKSILEEAGFMNVSIETAAEVIKPGSDGENKFSLFLAAARKI